MIFKEVGTTSRANLIQMVYSITTLTLPLPNAGRAILGRAAVAVETDKLATKQLRHRCALGAKSILNDLECCLGLWKDLSPTTVLPSVLLGYLIQGHVWMEVMILIQSRMLDSDLTFSVLQVVPAACDVT